MESPAQLAIGIIVGSVSIVVGILIFSILASSPAAPEPGDPFYRSFVVLTQYGPKALLLLGSLSALAVVAWIINLFKQI